MSRRNKLEKFADILEFSNVFESYDIDSKELTLSHNQKKVMKGKWLLEYFKNEMPITLELACGYGEYTVDLGKNRPLENFIGIDVKGNRIWKGAKIGLDEKITNIAFLRTRIEILDYYFAANEVQNIWLTFPDPFLKKSKSNRRLTAPNFLSIYKKIIKPDGNLYLKTDSSELFEFSLEVFDNMKEEIEILHITRDVYADSPIYLNELNIKTRYEKIHSALGKSIKFVHFRFK